MSSTPELGKTDSKQSQRTTLLMNKEARIKNSRERRLRISKPEKSEDSALQGNSSQPNTALPVTASVVDINRMTEKQLPKRSTSQMENIMKMSENLNLLNKEMDGSHSS